MSLDDVDNLTIQLEKCWATPSSDPNDSISYTIIDSSAGFTTYPYNDDYSAGIDLNCVGQTAKFWFQSFQFVDHQGKLILIPVLYLLKTQKLTIKSTCTAIYMCAIQKRKIVPTTLMATTASMMLGIQLLAPYTMKML